MPIHTPMLSHDTATSVAAWLAHIGIAERTRLGPWQLSCAKVLPNPEERGVEVVFSDPRHPEAEIPVRLVATDAKRPAFARTASLDISHGHVAAPLLPVAAKLVRAIHAIVTARDPGGLPMPAPPPSAEPPPPEPAPAARETPQPQSQGAYASASAKEPDDNPALRVGDGEHFLAWHFLELDELDRFPNAIHDIVHNRLGGLIIRRVFTPEHMAAVVQRLERDDLAFPRTFFPPQFKSHFLGRCLDGSAPDLVEYLDDAERFRAMTRAAFADGPDFQTRLEEVFARLSGGRTVGVPRYDGRAYSPATIRVLPEGGQIGSHCGNEMGQRPAYTHLNALIDDTDQVSYFLTLQEPEAGGELVVYSLLHSTLDDSLIRNGRTDVDAILPTCRWEAYRPAAGDLLIFDGGRYLHRVSVVRGARTRWTIGGFLMLACDGGSIFYWS